MASAAGTRIAHPHSKCVKYQEKTGRKRFLDRRAGGHFSATVTTTIDEFESLLRSVRHYRPTLRTPASQRKLIARDD